MSESANETFEIAPSASAIDITAIEGRATAYALSEIGDYQNFGFTVGNADAVDDPWMLLDTRNLPADFTVAELGKLLSLTMRVRKSVVDRSFVGVERAFTEAPL